MAQGPIPASELEGDIRQDGFRTRYIPERDEFPTAYDVNNQNFHYENPPVFSEIYPVLPVQVHTTSTEVGSKNQGWYLRTYALAGDCRDYPTCPSYSRRRALGFKSCTKQKILL